MKARFLDQSFLGMLTSCLLASMLLVSSGSYVPHVPLTELWAGEEGLTLYTEGIAVDVWLQGSGEKSVRIADLASGASAKVMIRSDTIPGVAAISIGDEIAVVGQLSNSFGTACIFSDEGDVRVVRSAKEVLTVGMLVKNWMLFLDDPVQLRGILQSGSSGSPVLRDLVSEASLALSGMATYPSEDGVVIVEVAGRLLFDENGARLVILLESLTEIR